MSHLQSYLPNLRLNRLGDDEPAGLWIASLPWPRAAAEPLTLDSHPTFVQPLGQWPGEAAPQPRRLLLIADGKDSAPAQISPIRSRIGALPQTGKLSAEMELFARSPHQEYVWERHLLRLRCGDRSVGLAMGLRVGDETHWWEACGLVVLEETPQCLVVEMGGAIPHHLMTFDEFTGNPGLTNPYLHKHNWLSGHIYARLHANGVCEVFAHHINSKFVDDGLDLQGAVPVIGIRTTGTPSETAAERQALCGPWDGTRDELQLDGVRFDLTEAARLATAQQPGHIGEADDFLVWQPYEGMELYGGLCADQLLDDPFIFRAEDRAVPRGMARTLRFSLSLSDRSPRIARYLAPAWWYGACEEFLPEPLLPVSNAYNSTTEVAATWLSNHIVNGGFEDGSVARNGVARRGGDANARCEPGWEGEVPYAQFLRAWRTGDAGEYSAALRSAYYFTDVVVDHAAKAVRMHGFPPHAFAVPMNRMQGSIAAYLETGDRYLLQTARAVTADSYSTHLNSWPRMAVGRDACFARSAVMLYRYFADEFFRQIAHETTMTVVQSQRPDGSFGDQGGGSGLHMWSGYITKPWMGLLALGATLDYLELFPHEPILLESVRKFADWLMAERFDHNGILTWSYQHDFDGRRRYFCPTQGKHIELPGNSPWHQESLGRLLLFCAIRFDEPAYFEAWSQSRTDGCEAGDHAVSAALQFVPWVQAKLWGATVAAEGVQMNSLRLGALTPEEGCILTPAGEARMRWTADGDCTTEEPALQEEEDTQPKARSLVYA